MQRRSTILLLKRALHLAPKRPIEGMSATSAAAAPTTNAGYPAPPQQQQQPVRPVSVVTPSASAAANGDPISSGGGSDSGSRRKKIIRRIVKRKKVSSGSATPTSENVSVSPAGAVSAAAETAAPPTSRARAMLQEIRKQPEGALEEEEEQYHHHSVPPTAAGVEESTSAQNPSQGTKEPEEEELQYRAVNHHANEEVEETSVAANANNNSSSESAAARYAADMQALHDETDESAGTTSTTSNRKTAMVKGYRIDEIINLCSPSDAIFARRLPSGGCQFFAWPGTPLPVASKAIMSMPDTIRTVHSVFGRVGTPMDIVLDIDCQVPQEYWTMTKIRPFQVKLLDDVLSVLKEEIEKIGESIETQVVLQSPNLKKASFHVHTKLKDAAFADFNSLHGFLCKFQERLPHVDMQIYRPHGMLRMFSCMKENHTSAIVVFGDPKWNIGFPNGKVSDEQAALHSVCVRDPLTFTRTLTFASPRAYLGASFNKDEAGEGDTDGEGRRLPPQVRLPRTEKEAIENASRWLRSANEVEVGEWRTWIGLGLCAYRVAHHFRNAKGLPRPAMEEMLDAWTEASRKCPLKYHPGECEARWAAFSPNKLGDRSDWWGAYKRLGRLEAAAMEAAEQDAAEKANREAHYKASAGAAAAAVAPAALPADNAAHSSGAKESVPSASRKLKLKKRAMRSSS